VCDADHCGSLFGTYTHTHTHAQGLEPCSPAHLSWFQSRKRTARWWSRLWCYKVPKRRQRPTNVTDLVKLKLFRIRRGSAAQLDRHIESEYTDPVRRLSNMSDESDDALLGTGLAEPKQYALTIRYENLHLTVKTTGKTVLQNCTGTLKAGKVTAIMGPSGAGKSSFVGAITGSAATYGNITGDMYINGMKRTLSDFRDVCGFVPQDDTMHTDLKVREVLFYQVRKSALTHPPPHLPFLLDAPDGCLAVLASADARVPMPWRDLFSLSF
jgi:ABC-type multidrug transport system fused ATPase/permease subunit